MHIKNILAILYNRYLNSLFYLNRYMLPLLLISSRFWIASIFWYSGLTKLSSWPATIFLFQEEYKVPFLPVELAAFTSTAFELICPVLLVLGLFTRLACLPLLAMISVIEFTYSHHTDHIHWGIILGFILCIGSGALSLDSLLLKHLKKRAK